MATARIAIGTLPPASFAEPVCVHPPHVSHPNNAYGYSIHDDDCMVGAKYAFGLSNSGKAKAKVKVKEPTTFIMERK